MKYFKLIAKIFAVFALVFSIGLGALIWRVHHAPLDLEFLLSYLKTKDAIVTVDSIQLEKSTFYKIPQINIQNLQYKTPNTEITCRYIRGYWDIWNVLRGKLSLSSLMLFKPKIIIRLTDTPQETNPLESLKVLEGLPFSSLSIIDGELIVIPADSTLPPVTVTGLGLTLDHRNRLTNWDLTGLLFDRIPLKGTGHFHHNTLNAQTSLDVQEMRAQDVAAYTKSVQNYLPLFGTKAWNMHATLHSNAKTEGTITWSPPGKADHEFSANFAQTPLQPLELIFKLPLLNVNDLPQQWPETLAPAVRNWILKNIPKGDIFHTEIHMSLAPSTHEVKNIKGTTSLKDAQVKVWDRLSLLQVDQADFTFDPENLSIVLHKGMMEDLPLEKSKIVLSKGLEHIQINTSTKAEAQSAFKLLDKLAITHPLVTSKTKGMANLDIDLGFAFQDPKNLQINVRGDLKHAAGSVKVSNKTFTFSNGEFNLGFSNEAFFLKGQTILEHKPIQLSLHTANPMDPQSRLTYDIHGQADSKVAKVFLPPWLQNVFKDGIIGLNISSTINSDQEEVLDLEANLKMVALNIAPLGWEKLRNADGYLKLEMRSKDKMVNIPHLHLESPGLILDGNLEFKDTSIENLNLKASVKNNQQLRISTQRTNKGLVFSIFSNFLDARPLLKYYFEDTPKPASEESPMAYQLDLDMRNILLENGIKIPLFKGNIMDSGPGFTYIDLTANTTKGGQFAINLKPKGNQSILTIKASKFDEFLRGLDWHKKVTIERIDLTATRPLKQIDKPYEGKILVENVRLHNAPLIGHILSIMSLESLVSQMSGKGLLFVIGEAEFNFLQKTLKIHRSAITSTALGLSFQGDMDFKNKLLNLDGAAVPVNVLNKMIGNIPLLGKILTGGDKDKGVFSSSYKITGSFDNPDVKSNPLGIVVPNGIKKIFGGLMGSNAKST